MYSKSKCREQRILSHLISIHSSPQPYVQRLLPCPEGGMKSRQVCIFILQRLLKVLQFLLQRPQHQEVIGEGLLWEQKWDNNEELPHTNPPFRSDTYLPLSDKSHCPAT